MKFIYLMIKKHKITGKKYLCKKVANNDKSAITYKGSGLRWKRHLEIHGNDVDTEILYKCPTENKNEFRNVAIDYSNKLNILNDPSWLNLVIEEGQGGSRSDTSGTKGKKWMYKDDKRIMVSLSKIDEYLKNGWIVGFPDSFRKMLSNNMKGKIPANKGKKMKLPHEYTSRQSKRKYDITGTNLRNPYTTEMRSVVSKECLNRPEVLAKFRKPRKPLIIAQNVNTHEIKTLGRHEWWTFDKVHYKRLLKGRISKGWKLVDSPGLEPGRSAYEAHIMTF